MLYLSKLQSAFDQSHLNQLSEAERERIASELLALTNHIPPACDSRPELASMVGDRDDPEWFVLDVDELPGPDELH